ncbi:M14 family zinc carboxypeptidase [Flavobacterium eburneipallidum]|uniref:M14 family zinc carboxypeptidase n=1 Tax=Flavobacterium eburneipallidum TaxID=3003263 RepID=UPI0024826B01|nr:M14 family zinc carboxypeptidase [Flavobacterium eburneipallidum]
MKKITFYLLSVLLASTFLHSQTHNHESHNTKTEPNEIYKKIKIANPTPELMNKLGRLGLDLDCGSQFDQNGDLLIEVSTYEESKVKTITAYQVVVADMEGFYAKRAVKDLPQAKTNLRTLKASSKNKSKNNAKTTSIKSTTYGNITHRFENTEIDWTVPANFQLGASFGGCLTVDETLAQLDLMRSLYPNLITAKVNASPTDQRTIGGRPIYVVKISNSAISGTKPETLYTGMTHSREVSSLMNLTYYMWYLLENYATDPDVKNLVDHHDLYFIPIVNPDGLAYNQAQSPNGGGMQRKNRRETGACTTYLDGIDLNRNWGTYWGYDNEGSSPNGCDDTYRGTAGFSEAETSIIRDFFLLHNFKTSVNHHAYKNAALHGRAAFYRTNNLATNPGVPTGRENEYYQYSHDMTQFSRYAYGSSPNISYWNNGNCNDWMSEGSGKNTLCWTPENGAPTGEGGFWPTPTQITPIAKRAVRMNFIAAYYSGVYAKLHDLTKSDITSTSGTLNFGLERVGQTDGDFTLTVTPISSNILSVTNVAVQTGMTVLQQRNLDVNFTLSPTIANKEKIEFEVTLSNGSYIIYKTRIEKYYNPTSIFTSLANPTTLALAGWTASGTASWAITTTDGFGGTAGITTNTAASYANAITTANLTQTNAISLAGKQQVAIQFNAKWDLERSFDYVQLQGSPDGGTTWITMNGKYTKPGTTTSVTDYSTTLSTTSKTTADKGFQPDGQALYDGDKFDKWVLEEYYISATENAGLFNKASVKFRFILRTDSNNRNHGYNTTFKGFRFDNFKVLEIISSPPVAICKDATLSLNSSGSLTVLTTDVNNGSTDDIGITSISVSPNTFNCTHANTVQAVTLTVTDADGQTSTCTANVTINDVTPPVTPTLANVTAQCSVTPTAPTTTDTCAGTITGTTSTTFPITTQGTTIVTWSFNDGNGNTTTADQNIIIDNTTPQTALLNISAQCSATPNTPTITLFCNQTITGTTNTIFPITTQGTTVVTWTFDDGNGTIITQNQNVIIDDTIAPIANITSLPNVSGQNSVTVTAPPTATDNCKGTIVATTPNPLTYSTPGNFTIVWTYDDGNGNTSTQTQTVVVVDTLAPSVPTGLSASGTTTTTTNLTWTASTDNSTPISYDVYRGTTKLATVTTTNYTVTGLTANTVYSFTVAAKDGAGNTSTSSNTLNVNTLPPPLVYCNSQGTSTSRERIGKVVLGNINNTSTGSAGYENFTAIATNANRGTAYTITITPSWTSSRRNEGYAVWIDYNSDGDFADTGELVFSRAISTTTPISGTFTIPTTATIGATRMRVSMKYNGIPTACETFASGQVEDYTVNIVSSTARIASKTNNSISSTILVYPNPTTGILNIKETSSSATYTIYNLLGQSIIKGNLSNNIIDLSGITSGNYVLEILDNGNTTNKRIIKQ